MADETTESQNQDEAAGIGGPEAGDQPPVEAGSAAEGPTQGRAPGDRRSPGGGRPGQGGRGRGGGPRGKRDAASSGLDSGLDEVVVRVYRCATVVKGGRRFSFGALVVVGDRQSRVGIGYGKANEVPSAVDKGRKAAQRNMITVKLQGTTIPHQVTAKYGASKVLLVPAGKGTGVIAGASVRAVMELAGIKDVLTKAHGSTGPKNLVKAAFAGLAMLRQKDEVASLRQVSLA